MCIFAYGQTGSGKTHTMQASLSRQLQQSAHWPSRTGLRGRLSGNLKLGRVETGRPGQDCSLHTLRWQGPDSDPGVNTRALRRLFEVIKEREEDYR